MRIGQFDSMQSQMTVPSVNYGAGQSLQERASLEAFIAEVFKRHYNADIAAYCRRLVGIKDIAGQWAAGAGINFADEGSLFLERYLDTPIEQVLCELTDSDVVRSQIAEVGNLAALHPGSTRKLIVKLTQVLKENDRTWVAFTATRSLINSFHRLGLAPVVIAPADKARMPNPQSWGTYYDHQPHVAFGNVMLGYNSLLSREMLVLPAEVQ